MRLTDLLDQRGRVKAELTAILDKPEGKDDELSAAQERRFDELKSEADGLEKKIERQAFLDEMDRRLHSRALSGPAISGQGPKFE